MSNTCVTRMQCLALLVVLHWLSPADAAINGFGNFSNFMINRADSSALPDVVPGTIHITTMAFDQSRSIFFRTPQDISHFTASYSFKSVEGSVGGLTAISYGAAFVIQNSLDGPGEVAPGVGSTFGYGGGCESACGGGRKYFEHSIAVTLEDRTLSLDSSSTGVYTNGVVEGGSYDTSLVDSFSGNWIHVQLTYDGSLVHQVLTDTATLASHENYFPVNIPAIVGGQTAYVGFTAGNGFAPGDQYLPDFQFGGVPEPSAGMLAAIAGVSLMLRRRKQAENRI